MAKKAGKADLAVGPDRSEKCPKPIAPLSAAPHPHHTHHTHHTLPAAVKRVQISFRQINLRGTAQYDPTLQRHHLLPRQLLSKRCFHSLFVEIGRDRIGFDDFRANGLLLPATEEATHKTGMPLHRGPHRRYNEVVMERVGRIEARWIEARKTDPEGAMNEALMRLRLLQIALRRRLLAERRRIVLNRRDPLGTGFDFAELDAMAEALWTSTGP